MEAAQNSNDNFMILHYREVNQDKINDFVDGRFARSHTGPQIV